MGREARRLHEGGRHERSRACRWWTGGQAGNPRQPPCTREPLAPAPHPGRPAGAGAAPAPAPCRSPSTWCRWAAAAPTAARAGGEPGMAAAGVDVTKHRGRLHLSLATSFPQPNPTPPCPACPPHLERHEVEGVARRLGVVGLGGAHPKSKEVGRRVCGRAWAQRTAAGGRHAASGGVLQPRSRPAARSSPASRQNPPD